MFWGVLSLVVLRFSLSHLSPFFENVDVLKQLSFVGSCVFASLSWTDNGVVPPKDVSLRCWSCGTAMWTLSVWVPVLRGVVTVLLLVQFLLWSIELNELNAWQLLLMLQRSNVQKKEKSSTCGNECAVQMSSWNWFILAFHNWNRCAYVFFFLNWKLFLPESHIHKQNNVSCKTKQTLPIRLPLWGSVQCWYFHESVFQNLKGNNIRLYGWWLAGKTTKRVLLLDNMTFVVLLIFNKYAVLNFYFFSP